MYFRSNVSYKLVQYSHVTACSMVMFVLSHVFSNTRDSGTGVATVQVTLKVHCWISLVLWMHSRVSMIWTHSLKKYYFCFTQTLLDFHSFGFVEAFQMWTLANGHLF